MKLQALSLAATLLTLSAASPISLVINLSTTGRHKTIATLDDDYVNPPHTGLCLKMLLPDKDVAAGICTGDMVPVKLFEGGWTCCQKAPGTSSQTKLVEGKDCRDMRLPKSFVAATNSSVAATKSKSTSILQKNLSEVAPFDDYVNPPHSPVCLRLCLPDERSAQPLCSAHDMVTVKDGACFTCCVKPNEGQLTLEL